MQTTSKRTVADRLDTVADRADQGHGHKVGADKVVRLLLTAGKDDAARQVQQAIAGRTDSAALRRIAQQLRDEEAPPAETWRGRHSCGPREDGATLDDGRPRCRCGQPANPAGYCCETGALVQLPGERRRVVSVGWDGGSYPMLRFADELHLADYQRSIVPTEEWPEGEALRRAVEDERRDRVRAGDEGREPGRTASGRRWCPSCREVERAGTGLVHTSGCPRVHAGLVA